ncbi:MAG TPA: alpha/beta hydrolase [Devosiaceae bacterium]
MTLDADMAAAMTTQADLITRDGGKPADAAGERAQQARLAPFWNEGAPSVAGVEELSIPGAVPLRARLFRPTLERTPIVIFVHGGGWRHGSIDTTEWHSRALAAGSGLAVLAISYRLAPEHPFPAGLDDVTNAIRWCAAGGLGPGLDHTKILLSGASAGANLALAATLRLRDEGGPAPRGLALYYGVFGDDLETESYRAFGDGRFGLSQAGMQAYFEAYLPAGHRPHDPYVAPLHASLAGLPPTWLGVAELDVLRDDSLLMDRRLRDVDVSVETQHYPGLVHGFCGRARMVPAARQAIVDGAGFLARCV